MCRHSAKLAGEGVVDSIPLYRCSNEHQCCTHEAGKAYSHLVEYEAAEEEHEKEYVYKAIGSREETVVVFSPSESFYCGAHYNGFVNYFSLFVLVLDIVAVAYSDVLGAELFRYGYFGKGVGRQVCAVVEIYKFAFCGKRCFERAHNIGEEIGHHHRERYNNQGCPACCF